MEANALFYQSTFICNFMHPIHSWICISILSHLCINNDLYSNWFASISCPQFNPLDQCIHWHVHIKGSSGFHDLIMLWYYIMKWTRLYLMPSVQPSRSMYILTYSYKRIKWVSWSNHAIIIYYIMKWTRLHEMRKPWIGLGT